MEGEVTTSIPPGHARQLVNSHGGLATRRWLVGCHCGWKASPQVRQKEAKRLWWEHIADVGSALGVQEGDTNGR